MNYILLKLPNWLGDTIMLTPTIDCLRRVFPKAKLILVGNTLSTSIFETNNFVKKIFIDKSKDSKGLLNRINATITLALEINQYLKEINIESIDCAITFQNNFFSAFLLAKINAKKKVGYGDKNIFGIRRFLLTHCVKYISGRPPICNHQVLSYINLLLPVLPIPFFKQYKNIENNIYYNNASSVQNILFSQAKELKLYLTINTKKIHKQHIVAISSGASYGSSKMWLENYFVETIVDLAKNGFYIRIYGAKNEVERNTNIYNNALKLLPTKIHSNIENLSGQTNIKELANSLNECSLYIGNDSGTTHIAKALNIPSIVLFGPMPFEWCSPWSNDEIDKRDDHYYMSNVVAIRKEIACSPCKKKICPLKHHNCMKLITPDEVLNVAYNLLHFSK